MKRRDLGLLALSAVFLLAAAVLLKQAGSAGEDRRDPRENPAGPGVEADHLALFEKDLTPEERRLFQPPPESPFSGREAPDGGDGESKPRKPLFGEMPIPPALAGVQWKSGSIFDIVSTLARRRQRLDGLEVRFLMRALVARLRGSGEDLEGAIQLSRRKDDPEIRRLLLIALGRTGKGAADDFLIELASGDRDPGMRDLAILSLAQNGVEPDLNGDPEILRGAASPITAEPIDELRGKAAKILPELLEKETDPEVLVTLIAVLQSCQADPRYPPPPKHEVDAERVTKLIVGYALHAESLEVRRTAIRNLQYTKSPEALKALSRIVVESSDRDSRRTAARVLGGVAEDETVFRALARAASSDPDADVRASAASSFYLSPSAPARLRARALDLWVRLYRKEASPDVRWVLVHKFSVAGEGGKIHLRQAYASDPDPVVREYAGELLRRAE